MTIVSCSFLNRKSGNLELRFGAGLRYRSNDGDDGSLAVAILAGLVPAKIPSVSIAVN